ncbi:MAG: protein translocase subunit SecF [Campylobacter sp.]|nr:protein translocase subunit SecF [Campylobacter sp.]
MQIFDKGKVYDFMGARYIFLVVSILLFVGSLILLGTQGLKLGIDFSGGTLVQVKYDSIAPLGDIRDRLTKAGIEGASVTEFGSDEEITIRYSSSNESLGSDVGLGITQILKDSGNFEVRKIDIVVPKVGEQLKKSGFMAILVSLLGILIYIGVRFEWRFAFSAIVSEIHDIVIVLGFISLMRIDVNLDTLAAILTVIGYSLNDTIIIFDRVRESIQENDEKDLKKIMNEAVSRTLSRTIMTSVSTLISVLVLFFFGGDMIHNFASIMTVGIFIGTYSSIFIAVQALLWFRFNVVKYIAGLAEKKRRKKEKEKMRAMYERGSL